jgi:nitroreductase
MSETTVHGALPIPADQVDYLLSTAARAPSVHNTQPWRFRINPYDIELLADPRRKLRVDPVGREMLVSCGAALFGLRLAVRSLGYRPIVTLLPDRAQLRLLARISLVAGTPMTAREREMLNGVPHRHTHRGAFLPGPLPPWLVAGMQHDALAEGATLALVQRPVDYERLASLLAATGPRQDIDPAARADIMQWASPATGTARDGIPTRAFPSRRATEPGRLRQRDFDLGRGVGQEPASGESPAGTAVLLTLKDGRADWLHSGQALQRLLLHAASRWVFASLYTQPLESAQIRHMVAERLALPGFPQVLLQFGRADTTQPTSRRPTANLVDEQP